MIDIRSQHPFIISGPCSAETEEQTVETCRAIAASGRVNMLRAGIWKPRTKPGSFEGIGIKGLAWMNRAREITGLPYGVEIANARHAEAALEFDADMLWIGARTTVNPFSVQDIADALKGTNKPILVKNPMHADLDLWAGAVARLQKVGVENVGLIHRGFSMYGASKYRNAPMWHLAIEMRSRFPEMPMICDPSHISGCRDYLLEIAQASADLRFNGLMVESHLCPAEAWSDAAQQLTPDDLISFLDSVQWRAGKVDSPQAQEALSKLRSEIDLIDADVFSLLGRRMEVADKIGSIKKENNVAILQGDRWQSIVERVITESKDLNLSRDFLTTVLEAIHLESINRQNKIMNDSL
ncbi:MAG: chorismate mutase [Rikenellaceae bacterium]